MPGSGPAASARYTFRKAERLCSRRLLDGLFKHGTAFNTYPLRFVVWRIGAGTTVSGRQQAPRQPSQPDSSGTLRPAHAPRLQVVLSVSKRYFKRAHDRNRIKRLLREAWRHHKHLLAAEAGALNPQPVADTDPAQPSPLSDSPSTALLIAVLYIGKEKPESLDYLARRLRKGIDRLRTELTPAAPPSPV